MLEFHRLWASSLGQWIRCCCSVAQLCLTLCNPMDCSMPGFPVLHHLLECLKLISIELVMPPYRLILCHPFSSCPPSFPASGSFSMSQLFVSGGQSIGASASAAALPVTTEGRKEGQKLQGCWLWVGVGSCPVQDRRESRGPCRATRGANTPPGFPGLCPV